MRYKYVPNYYPQKMYMLSGGVIVLKYFYILRNSHDD